MRICMFVSNPISRDPRVKREASSLVQAGHEVTIIGATQEGSLRHETWRGVKFLRIAPFGHRVVACLKRLLGVAGRQRAAPDAAEEPATVPPPGQARPQTQRNLILRWRLRIGDLRVALMWVTAGLWQRADAYHAHDLDTLLFAHWCARLRGKPLVYDSHELYVEWSEARGAPAEVLRRLRRIERRGARNASFVITVSDGIADELERLYDIPRPLVIRNCDELRPLAARTNRLREQIGGDRHRPIVLYQGGFIHNRGLPEIVAAADMVPDADFVLIGHDSTFKEEIRLAASKSKRGNVFVLPYVPLESLWEYTCSADAGFVLTQPFSRAYALTLSNKVFEYMAAGIAIIASNTENHRYLAEETGAFVLVDPYRPEDIAQAVNNLISTPHRMKQMGAQAHLWAERKYNAAHEMKKLRAAYAALRT